MKSSTLMRQIAAFNPNGKPDRKPARLRHAIVRVRDHIAGLFGIKAADITDAHVAAFVQKPEFSFPYTYRNMNGIGYLTEKALKQWAKQQRS